MKHLILIALFGPLAAFAQTKYKIDPTHTSIVFKVDHMGFSNVYGMFDGGEGQFTINDAKPEASSFDITVKADTITTLEPKRDEHLKGPDFFNVKQFPTITLKSKSVKKTGNDYAVTADLTMRGVTKPVSFTFKPGKIGQDPWGKTRAGGETTFTVKRTDFGVSYMSKPGEVGNDIQVTVSVEGVKE